MTPATEADLETALSACGITWQYGYYGSGPGDATDETPMPRILYRFKLTPDVTYADGGEVVQRNARYDVELEEAKKDFDLEKRVGDALTAAGIGWDRYEYAQDGSTEGSHWLQVIWEVTVTED